MSFIGFGEPDGLLISNPALDHSRYKYMACPVSGDCLSNRPGGPVNEGDVVTFRELIRWHDMNSKDFIAWFVRRLVVVSIQGQLAIKQLGFVDYANKAFLLTQFNPYIQYVIKFSEVTALYLVEDVQRNPLIIRPGYTEMTEENNHSLKALQS